MGPEVREVGVCGAKVAVGRLHIEDADPWGLRLVLADGEYSAVGYDLFESLQKLRRLLEADGQMLCVQGACRDVFPSGMSRQMGGGRGAYRITSGRRSGRGDLVDIFDAASCEDVVGVDEQIATVRDLHGRVQSAPPSARPPQWAVDQAKTVPNGWVYELDGEFGMSEGVPPEAIKGAWPVGPDGAINGAFMPNPRFRSDRD